MVRAWPSCLTVVVLAGIAVMVWLSSETRPPQALAAVASTGWEYHTVSVEIGTLANKLSDLSRDGWEVISILNTDFKVENEPDGKAHLMSVRLEVTAKRPKS